MGDLSNEEDLMRSVALQNAQSILLLRQRADEELRAAKDALELKSRELAHSLAIMRATLDSTTDGILVTDQDGSVTDFNRRVVDLWQVPHEHFEDMNLPQLCELIGPQLKDPKAFAHRVDEIYMAPAQEFFDVLELADGRVFERFSRVQLVNGLSIGRCWSFRDVTERRRAESTLRDEREVLELLNRTGTAIASTLELDTLLQTVTDAATQLSGAKFGAFFYANKNQEGDALMLYTLSGASREDFERFGQPRATALFGPIFEGEAPIRCDDVLVDERYGTLGPHHGMPPGHLPVRSYLGVPVTSRSGEAIGGLFFGHPEPAVFTERTERLLVGIAAQAAIAIDNSRLYEASLKAVAERRELLARERMARAEAEHMSAMKDEFLATLSHELRTPLSAILGWAQILRRGARNEADLNKGLETIERNARAQAQLVDDLLDMSRITSGKLHLEVQALNPAAFIEAALETVRPAADAKGISLETQLFTIGSPIAGDPNRLQQVMWNLLSNAIKFTPRNGQVKVLLEQVDAHIEIRVIDTGVGIDEGFLPHVFERFCQADGSITRRFGGLGLGLAIVKNLVELHGGSVQVTSPGEGHGSSFIVYLPLPESLADPYIDSQKPFTAASVLTPPLWMAQLLGVKVLVVDDEKDALDMVQRMLTECEAEVLTTSSADEVLHLIKTVRPDLLVCDIGMPEVDGFEVLRRVRALGRDQGGHLPAIALTAFARSEDRTRALRAGFIAHVAKPVEPSELMATIASLMGRAGEMPG